MYECPKVSSPTSPVLPSLDDMQLQMLCDIELHSFVKPVSSAGHETWQREGRTQCHFGRSQIMSVKYQ